MSIPDFAFRNPQPALTRAEIAANVAALPMPDGWTAQDDVALMEGLFRGLPVTNADRWKALKLAAGVTQGAVPWEAQKALMAIVRERADG